jgi:formate hydrogenlyase subunit 4
MIHEGMVLEYSGPSLAWIEWANAIKLHALLALLIALFSPWGMAFGDSGWGAAAALLFYGVKLVILIIFLSVLESAVAKLRMYLVPEFLGVASAVSALAVIFTLLATR